MQALAGLPGYRACTFRAWLYAIARNVVTDLHRARPTVALVDSDVVRAGLDDDLLQREDALDLRRLLDGLTSEQREVVELRLAGLSGPEIAEALGRSHGAVRALQFRAYQQLRILLDPKQVTS